MSLVDLEGAFDLHVHSRPSLFPRIGDDLDMGRHAVEGRLAGMLLKNHFESTVGRAALANRVIDKTLIFGGLVLNEFAGGLNPMAVDLALGLGAKEIWLPTIDALAHAAVYGHLGGFGYQESKTRIPRRGVSILSADGELKDEAKLIIELVRDAETMLGTGHLGRQEIFALARFAREVGLERLVITHPFFDPPNLSLADQAALVGRGATLEFCGGNLYPIPGLGRLENYVQSITQVGAKACILTSDAGQARKSLPAEVLRVFAQCLLEKGVSQKEIDIMTKENPARLLGL